MKQHISAVLLAALLCLSATDAFAGERFRREQHSPKGWSVSAFVNTPSAYASEMFATGHYYIGCADMFWYNLTLENIYSDYHDQTRSTGGFGVGVEYKFNHWISAGVDFASSFYYHNSYEALNSNSQSVKVGAAITLMPKVKLFYMDKPKCRLYTSFALGLAAYPGFYLAEDKVTASYQMSPIGVEFGKKFCGFVETGFGVQYSGLRAGVVYKF